MLPAGAALQWLTRARLELGGHLEHLMSMESMHSRSGLSEQGTATQSAALDTPQHCISPVKQVKLTSAR